MDEDIAEEEEEEEEALLFLLLRRRCIGQKRKKKSKNPRFWVRDVFRQREQYGEYSN